MAKATAPDTTTLSASEAATAIAHLINTKPVSPRHEELEAIISRVAPASMPQTAVLPPLSPHHLRYRERLAEIARLDNSDYSPGMSAKEKEEEVGAACEKAMALERKVWATPAKTLADVLLRGEMALYNENGVMETLDDPEAYYDERSIAQLIRAVVDVLGGIHAHVGLHRMDLPNVAHGLQVPGQIGATHSGTHPPAIECQRLNSMPADEAGAAEHRDQASLLQPRDHCSRLLSHSRRAVAPGAVAVKGPRAGALAPAAACAALF